MISNKNLSRRELIQSGAIFAVSSSISYPTKTLASPYIGSQLNLAALARSLKGYIILPGEVGYVQASLPRNTLYAETFPLAVALCKDSADVMTCLKWAKDNRIPFCIRSGGHNYAGFSTTKGLLIDIKAMNLSALDLKNGLIHIQGGANNRHLVEALRKTNFAVPAGRCWTVGVAGLTLGGGWGFSSTRLGLTCDSLVASRLVLPSTQEILVDDRGSFRDLAWAIRGAGGGNFGINTALSFRLSDVSGLVTTFNITWSAQKFVNLISQLQEIQNTNAQQIAIRIAVRQKAPGRNESLNDIEVNCLGQFFGSKKQLIEMLASAISLLAPESQEISEGSFWDATDKLGELGQPNMFYVRSSYIQDKLSEVGISTILANIMKWPGGSLKQNVLGNTLAIGGKAAKPAPTQSAYFHRNANYIFVSDVSIDPADGPDLTRRQLDWQANYIADMRKFMLPQAYVNFPTRDLNGWESMYYAGNLTRLSQLKRKYDPENIFRFEQSIPL